MTDISAIGPKELKQKNNCAGQLMYVSSVTSPVTSADDIIHLLVTIYYHPVVFEVISLWPSVLRECMYPTPMGGRTLLYGEGGRDRGNVCPLYHSAVSIPSIIHLIA